MDFTPRVTLILPLLVACASRAPDPPVPAPDPEPVAHVAVPESVIVMDTVYIESAHNQELENGVARLQFQLMEKDALIRQLNERLDGATQEAVRAMAKLRTLATRAEAASAMAEAQIALDGLRAAGGDQALIAGAEKSLNRARREYEGENYGGAVYLANDAKGQARLSLAAVEGSDDGASAPDEQYFATPVTLRTVKRSNVRNGPGLNHKVLFTLEPEVALTGQAYTDQWVRVSLGDGRSGWIFHTLVKSREEAP
jgi:Bacterial SH3 domain